MNLRVVIASVIASWMLLSQFCVTANAQAPRTILDLTEILVDDISNDATLFFGTERTGVTAPRKLSLAEIKKSMTKVEANTAGVGSPNILTTGERLNTLTNEGVTAKNYHTLPAAEAGATYTFAVQDTDGLRVTANTGDTIRLGANVTAAAGYVESTVIGDVIICTAINGTEWFGIAYGTWTDGTWSYSVIDAP